MRLSNFPKWRLNISFLIILTISSLILLACGPSASETTSPNEAKASKSVAKGGWNSGYFHTRADRCSRIRGCSRQR
ncbi:MAG: hypothetical protein Ct9H300mP27_01400 [Chloroflexota bacterium]|nr:MAG: hypothetical protein Ct9H300mP27_01400 [Chloroflexota bacterium]